MATKEDRELFNIAKLMPNWAKAFYTTVLSQYKPLIDVYEKAFVKAVRQFDKGKRENDSFGNVEIGEPDDSKL